MVTFLGSAVVLFVQKNLSFSRADLGKVLGWVGLIFGSLTEKVRKACQNFFHLPPEQLFNPP